MKKIALTAISCCLYLAVYSQQLTGTTLLDNSIRYHDPKGQWYKTKLHLHLTETRPNGPDRQTEISLDNKTGHFRLEQHRENNLIVREVKGANCYHSLNGSTQISEENSQKFRLNCEQTVTIKNYYTYLWGLPMKLKDPGTVIHEQVETKEFQGMDCLVLKATYEANVGKDTWYFYFNPQTYALVGFRFYHDESKNDGEYITLDGEESISGFRFPKKRTWYFNENGELLGADILDSKK